MKKTFLLLSLLLFTISTSIAQDSLKIVILSSKVGNVIDRNEREYYSLFKQYKNFSKVIFYKKNNKYYGNFYLIQSNGSERDTNVQYSEAVLLMLAEKINNWENLKTGNYKMGQNPPTIIIEDGEVITQENSLSNQGANKKYGNRIGTTKKSPLIQQDNLVDVRDYPKLSIGAGVGFYTSNFSKLKETIYNIEQVLKNEGYQFISHYNDSFSTNPLFYLFFKIIFSKQLEFICEIGKSYSDVDITSASATIIFSYPVLSSIPIFVFGGGGLQSYHFSFEKKYGISLNTGGTLESIKAEGNNLGPTIAGGIIYDVSKSLDICLYTNYSFIPSIETEIPGLNEKTSINLSGLSGGFKFSIVF